MKIHPQTKGNMSALADVLTHQNVGMLTLQHPVSSLASRPMTPIEMDASGAIWFIAARDTLPRPTDGQPLTVNLAFANQADGDYVSISGMATLVDDAARKQALWTLAARPWFSGPEDPRMVLLQLVPQHVEIWDGPDNAATQLLAMASSVLAGKPVGLGDKTVLDVSPSSLPGLA